MAERGDAEVASGSITYAGRALTIGVIGGPDVAAYNNLLFTSPLRPGITFAVRALSFDDFSMQWLAADSERLREAIRLRLLTSMRDRVHEALYDFVHSELERQFLPKGLTAADRSPVVFQVGHSELLSVLGRLGPHADAVAIERVDESIAPSLDAFRDAVRPLAEAKYFPIYAIGLPPPVLDDDAFERLSGIGSRAVLRYKISLRLNEHIARICEAIGVTYVDAWEAFASAGATSDATRVAAAIVRDYVAQNPAEPQSRVREAGEAVPIADGGTFALESDR